MATKRFVNHYAVEPKYCAKRVASTVYDRVRKQTAKWEPVSDKGLEFCGNVRPAYDVEKGKFVFGHDEFDEGYIGMYHAIPSSLLLYRLLCLFPAPVQVEDSQRYKCIWWVALKHKQSGETIMFGEWKGAAGIWTRFHDNKELPATYKRDLLLLLNELVAKDCPHPYDGCIAGSVA